MGGRGGWLHVWVGVIYFSNMQRGAGGLLGGESACPASGGPEFTFLEPM